MNKKILFLFTFALIFLIVQFASAATNITSCVQNLPAGDYELNTDLTATLTCLTINSSNVNIDCKGHTITYDSGGGATAYGINAIYLLVPLSNITIQNCIIQDNSTGGTPSAGIQFTRVTDSYIFNNSIQTNGTSLSQGIIFATGCKRNSIENNTINTLGSSTTNYGIYLFTEASNNIIIGNTITAIGTTTSYAIYFLTDSNENLIQNNTISTISTIAAGNNADPHAVLITSSNRNNITGNSIYSQGAQRSYAFYLTTSRENRIENNNITTNLTAGGTAYSIYLVRSDFTII